MKKSILFILFLSLGCENNKVAHVKKEVFKSVLETRSIDHLAQEYCFTAFLWKEGVTSDDVATVSQISRQLKTLSMERSKAGGGKSCSILSLLGWPTLPSEPLNSDDKSASLKEFDESIKELKEALKSKVDWIGEGGVVFDFSQNVEDRSYVMGVTLIGFNPSQRRAIFTTQKYPDDFEKKNSDIIVYEGIREVSYKPKGGRIQFVVHLGDRRETTYEFHLETVDVLKGKPLLSGQLVMYQNEKPIRYGVVRLN